MYGTSSEFGFDYLRDNSMAMKREDQCQRGHYFAIVDEVDSILIDEARTPLIISGPSANSRQMYDELKNSVSHIVKLQRDECNKIASEARNILDKLGMLVEQKEGVKVSKENEKEYSEAIKKLWLVNKGTPNNKILKRIRENPDLRSSLEQMETYYWSESNKEEKEKILANLFIILDERNSDFEITDKGVDHWAGDKSEFTMIDLGWEYSNIDNDNVLSDSEKIEKKVKLMEEDSLRKERSHNARQLFRAHLLMEKDVDYIVDDGKIIIIDENTGRPQPGRRFSDGLHQSIEAKESVVIQQETQTYATITLQNYFRMYDHLSGMTGTAITEAQEFKEIYKLDVLEIPTNKKCCRKDCDDEIYMTEREKYNAILAEIIKIHGEGRPILAGTESVESSEKLSRILKNHKIQHSVLNAKNHEKEAQIIAEAGRKCAVTVATNMAGRGTDIKLGEGVAAIGGLHVIGTSRHQSRRTDRQLRGRCGRQGDVGSSKFYISFEDSLMRLFASNSLAGVLQKFRPPEGEPISAPILNRSIETAQKRVEARNYTRRKHTLEYDDVMNKHRSEIYTYRGEVLNTENPLPLAYEMVESFANALGDKHINVEDGIINIENYTKEIMSHFPITIDETDFVNKKIEEIVQITSQKIIYAFKIKLKHEAQTISIIQKISNRDVDPFPVIHNLIRSLFIQCIDRRWQSHLLSIDHLREEVSMRTVAQKDPLIEFKHEAFALFEKFSSTVKSEITNLLFSFTMQIPVNQKLQVAMSQMQILGYDKQFIDKIDEVLFL